MIIIITTSLIPVSGLNTRAGDFFTNFDVKDESSPISVGRAGVFFYKS